MAPRIWVEFPPCQNPGCTRPSILGSLYCCRSCEFSARAAGGPWDIESYSRSNDDGSLAYGIHHHTSRCQKRFEENTSQ